MKEKDLFKIMTVCIFYKEEDITIKNYALFIT